MTDEITKLIENISQCLLPKLVKCFDQCDYHSEYQIRDNILSQQFQIILNLIGNVDLKNKDEFTYEIVSLLLIFNEELLSSGPWSSETSQECSAKLNYTFDLQYGVTLDKVFTSDFFDVQLVFDTCMKKLHEKLNAETLKHYPALVEVYCSLIQNIKEYKININPARTLAISLLLIDDYINENRIKGLSCCTSILECLSQNVFLNGNYYEVIYTSLKKVIVEKDLEVTKLVLNCTLQLLQIVPSDVKDNYMDQMYAAVLDELYVESNLYRKASCFNFIGRLIELHGVNCVKKTNFRTIICDNIDGCSNEDVADILLKDVLQCLETWIKYCWCVWRLSSDQKILMSLLKMLYLCQEQYVSQIQNLIITLIRLCTDKEQKQIYESIEVTQISNKSFIDRMNIINKCMKV